MFEGELFARQDGQSRFLDTGFFASQSVIIFTRGTRWLYTALISFQNFFPKSINYLFINLEIFWELKIICILIEVNDDPDVNTEWSELNVDSTTNFSEIIASH